MKGNLPGKKDEPVDCSYGGCDMLVGVRMIHRVSASGNLNFRSLEHSADLLISKVMT